MRKRIFRNPVKTLNNLWLKTKSRIRFKRKHPATTKHQLHSVLVQKRNRITTKRSGLQVLEKICAGKARVLPKKVYTNPNEFSLSDFGEVDNQRIIVRTDHIDINSRQSSGEWGRLPRENFSVTPENKNTIEREIKKWMEDKIILQSKGIDHRRIVFVVHKVPALKKYSRNIRIWVSLPEKRATVWIRNISKGEFVFRGGDGKTVDISLSENFKVLENSAEYLSKTLKSKELSGKIVEVLNDIISYADKTKEESFETSATTYHKKPNEPEFYDLLFGKEEKVY